VVLVTHVRYLRRFKYFSNAHISLFFDSFICATSAVDRCSILLPRRLHPMMPSLPADVAVVFSAAKLTPLPMPLLLPLLPLLPLLLTALPRLLPTALPPLPTALPQLPYEFSIILFLSNFTHLFLLFYPHHQELIGCDYGGLLSYFLRRS